MVTRKHKTRLKAGFYSTLRAAMMHMAYLNPRRYRAGLTEHVVYRQIGVHESIRNPKRAPPQTHAKGLGSRPVRVSIRAAQPSRSRRAARAKPCSR